MLIVVFFFKQKAAYEVHISDWSSDVCSSDLALGRAVADLGAKGYAVSAEALDVTDSAAVDAAAAAMLARDGRIDILINNAGIARSETAAENVADEHWLNVLDVNLNGSFWCARAFGRSAERRVGKECGSTSRSRWSPDH